MNWVPGVILYGAGMPGNPFSRVCARLGLRAPRRRRNAGTSVG
jgi:hypothetical protein